MLSSADLDKLVGALVEESYADGDEVVEEGATGDTFYILKSGACGAHCNATPVHLASQRRQRRTDR